MHTAHIAKIVRFRLKPDANVVHFIKDALATLPFVEKMGGMLSRHLSVDEAVIWTDHLTWESMAHAKAAQSTVMKEPSFGPFMQHIDESSVEMRHAALCWTVSS